jgi:hypothetical protein
MLAARRMGRWARGIQRSASMHIASKTYIAQKPGLKIIQLKRKVSVQHTGGS